MESAVRRVVITGLGVICPLGNTKEALWDALLAGRSGVTALDKLLPVALTRPPAGVAGGFTGSIEDFGSLEGELKKSIRKGLKLMCRESQMGVAAAQRSISDARLAPGVYDPERAGVVFGADYMLSDPEELNEAYASCLSGGRPFEFSRWASEGLPKIAPLWLLKYLPNMPASHVAIYNDLRGPNNSLTHREAAANLAVGESYRVILRGHADVMVVGAAGTRIHPMKALHAAQHEELANGEFEPQRATRPFDLNRRGMVLGEGAGAVVLEELEFARARGATIYAEVVGAASSSVADANLIARRDAALANAMRAALTTAGLRGEEIGHVHAHGLSTRSCDIDEARAIGQVFAGAPHRCRWRPPRAISAIWARRGMIELAASTLALVHDRLFPVLNYETPDPECPLAVVRSTDARPGKSFLNNSVTPQGQASCVLVRRLA